MNFTPTRKTESTIALDKFDEFSCDHGLQLYQEVPDVDINLDEFEEWTIERLKGNIFNTINDFFPNYKNLIYVLPVYSFTNTGTARFEGQY